MRSWRRPGEAGQGRVSPQPPQLLPGHLPPVLSVIPAHLPGGSRGHASHHPFGSFSYSVHQAPLTVDIFCLCCFMATFYPQMQPVDILIYFYSSPHAPATSNLFCPSCSPFPLLFLLLLAGLLSSFKFNGLALPLSPTFA